MPIFSAAERGGHGRLSVGEALGVLRVGRANCKLFQGVGAKCFHYKPPASLTEDQPASLGEAGKCSANNLLGRRKLLECRNLLAATVQVGRGCLAD